MSGTKGNSGGKREGSGRKNLNIVSVRLNLFKEQALYITQAAKNHGLGKSAFMRRFMDNHL